MELDSYNGPGEFLIIGRLNCYCYEHIVVTQQALVRMHEAGRRLYQQIRAVPCPESSRWQSVER